MRIQYVSNVMHNEDFLALFPDRSKMPGQQIQKFHRLILEGLTANGCMVDTISAAPITPGNYPRKMYPGGVRCCGNIRYGYIRTLNVPVVKNLCQMAGGFFRVLFGGKKDTAVVCDVLHMTVSLGAAIAARIMGKPCVGVVTDLPELMVTEGAGKSYSRLVYGIIKLCTHYVLLTEQMNDVVNPNGKPYVIIEGLCDGKMAHVERSKKEAPLRKCLYAGLLDARYGVKNMVEAFLLADIPDASLEVYGNGPYASELEAVAAAADNVVFHGTVSVDTVVQAELEATLLVNPRPTHEEFTKYSFPSKNMEYMASGTPVLTTNLAGMPEEYHQHVYLFDEESVEHMAQTFRNILSLDQDVLWQKGAGAKEFVLKNKNNTVQAGKIISMLQHEESYEILSDFRGE